MNKIKKILGSCYYTMILILSFSTLFLIQNVGYGQSCGLIPTPRQLLILEGDSFVLNRQTTLIFKDSISTQHLIYKQFEQLFDLSVSSTNHTAKQAVAKDLTSIHFQIDASLSFAQNPEQGYQIDINNHSLTIRAITEKGLWYGWQSVKQLFRYYYKNGKQEAVIPSLQIIDYPALQYRGWMDDISRGPIPTLSFIKKQIEILSEYKLNFFTLYTEHTFRSNAFPDIAPADGLTAQQIKELEEYAFAYGIELFGNQQCLAHAEKTLCNPFYNNIADTKYNLNPGTEATYSFLEQLLNEEAEAYSSSFFNINCDETESLGAGKGKAYVDSIGATTAYYRHINRVYQILKEKNKKVMMWGDIASKHNDILNNLPQDMIMIAWSYVAADNFNGSIRPIKDNNLTFFIAPGVSMWGTIFPSVETYTKNIANFVRDGYQNGALGMMNTAWDDNGEPLFNSAWHAMIWGAEMAWQPINPTHPEEADLAITQRTKDFNIAFNYQFFNSLQSNVILADYLSKLSVLEHGAIKDLFGFGALWEPLLNFYPPEIDQTALQNNLRMQQIIAELQADFDNMMKAYGSTINHRELLETAQFAIDKAAFTVNQNLTRIALYNHYINNSENIDIQNIISDNLNQLFKLKIRYSQLWDLENRSYWKNVILSKYDKLASSMLNIPQQVFIETSLSESNKQLVTLRTLMNDKPIYYTTDGSEPRKDGLLYTTPFTVEQSCLINAMTLNDFGERMTNSQYILCHKGIGHLHKLNSAYSTYRPEYSAGGDMGLLDGVIGSDRYQDGKWQGYQGTDIDVEINLQAKTDINQVKIRFIRNAYDWILLPKCIEIYMGNGKGEYKLVTTENIDISNVYASGSSIYTAQINHLNLKAQYLRIIIKNPGELRKGHPGAGHGSYIFTDEIVIE